MTNCLILGGSGFIGSHLAEALVRENHSVRVFGDFKSGMRNLESFSDSIEIIKGDFQNETDLASTIQDTDWIFHYISTTNPARSFDNPVYDIQTNIINSVRMMEIALKAGVKKIIFPSTGGTVYGNARTMPIPETEPANPLNPYAISKLTIEKYLHYYFTRYGMDYLVLRYSNPYGERQNPSGNQGVIPIFLNRIRLNEAPVIYGDGTAIRDYIYIGDVIDATISLLQHHSDNKLFNVGSGTGTSLNELIEVMTEITGKPVMPEFKPDAGLYIKKVVLDISRVQDETGWYPRTDIREGVKRTWEWVNQTRKC